MMKALQAVSHLADQNGQSCLSWHFRRYIKISHRARMQKIKTAVKDLSGRETHVPVKAKAIKR
jgi:hypothetical protein